MVSCVKTFRRAQINFLRRLIITVTGLSLCLLVVACSGKSIQSLQLDDSTDLINNITYALPRGYLTFGIKSVQGKLSIDPGLSVTYLPDPKARFAVKFLHSAFASDDLIATTNEQGLLTGINAVNEDQSVAIVQKVIELATGLGRAGALRFQRGGKAPPNFVISTSIDPFNSQESLREIEKISDLKVTITDLYGFPLPRYDERREEIITQKCHSSVCFRIVTPVILSISPKHFPKDFLGKFVMLVPSPYMVGEYDVRRAPCVKRTNILELKNGVLTKVQSTKPSEVLGCLQIPVDVAKAIVSIPAELIKVKVEQSNQDAALARAQASALTAQVELMKAQAALIAQQNTANSQQTPPTQP